MVTSCLLYTSSIAQQLTLVFINATVLLHALHEKEQFLVGHFCVVIRLEEAGNKLFPPGKEKIQRRQDQNPKADKGRAEQGEAFRGVLCYTLGEMCIRDRS